MSTDDVSDLVQTMNAVAATLHGMAGFEETLQAVLRASCDAVPTAAQVTVALCQKSGHMQTVAQSEPQVADVDQWQFELVEGPGYDALNSATLAWSDDLGDDPRWPTYGPKVSDQGYLSQMSVCLRGKTKAMGTLSAYSTARRAFDGHAREVWQLTATRAAAALAFADTFEGINVKLVNRTIIGEALGIVMERYHLDEDAAFKFLVRMSQTSNFKLRSVAEQLVASAMQRPAHPPG